MLSIDNKNKFMLQICVKRLLYLSDQPKITTDSFMALTPRDWYCAAFFTTRNQLLSLLLLSVLSVQSLFLCFRDKHNTKWSYIIITTITAEAKCFHKGREKTNDQFQSLTVPFEYSPKFNGCDRNIADFWNESNRGVRERERERESGIHSRKMFGINAARVMAWVPQDLVWHR